MQEEGSPSQNPWVQETLENVLKITRTNVLNWCNTVTKIGMDEERQKEWTTVFTNQIQELYEDMTEEVTSHQNKLSDKIERLLQKSKTLCKDLHIKMSGYGSKGLSLYEEKRVLEQRIAAYEQTVEDRRKEIAALKKQEQKLCNELGLTTLQALRLEVEWCENLKRANIELFVKCLREQLVNLWDKCHFLDEDRNFEHFDTDLYTEDLLTFHDMELQRIRSYYTKNRALFDLLEQREQLLGPLTSPFVPTNVNVVGTNGNVGGQLAKEEKECNALSKQIPKIEERLLQFVRDFEAQTGEQFLSWGPTVTSIRHEAHEKHGEVCRVDHAFPELRD